MLFFTLLILFAALWGLWNLYVQTLRFNELLLSCEETLQQLQHDVIRERSDEEAEHDI